MGALNQNLGGGDIAGIGVSGRALDASLNDLYGRAGVDYANLVAVSAAAALQANKAHLIGGTGYALTLPDPAANAGALIFLIVDKNATGLYPLTGSAYTLYAAESLTLRATPNGWAKIGGELLDMSARIETAFTQQDALTQNAWYTIPYSLSKENNALPGLVELTSKGFRIQRNGRYTIGASGALKNITVNGQYYFALVAITGSTSKYLIANYAATASGVLYGTIALTTTAYLMAGTLATFQVYAGPPGNLLGTSEGNQFVLTLNEKT